MRVAILIHLLAAFLAFDANAHIKTLTPKTDELLLVKTALGIATIIQTPTPIQSAVIGDQSGFKVEYLDNAVTIKPLRYGVKTNLYLMTDKRRFNLRLVTLSQDQSDYVVYIKDASRTPEVKWKFFGKEVSADGYLLKVNKVSQVNENLILIEAKLSSNFSKEIKPDHFSISQKDQSKVIDGLFLSSLTLIPKKPILIGISLSKFDLLKNQPITFKIDISKRLSIQIPEWFVWK